jgi:heme-degrading monooxygenase HmoA
MIARVWLARATPALAPAYVEHFKAHVLPTVCEVDGYAGATLVQREASGRIEIVVTTWWRSLDAIRAFAGDDQEAAVVAG